MPEHMEYNFETGHFEMVYGPDRRLLPYRYRDSSWTVHHYVHPQQFIACKGGSCVRADTQEEVERILDIILDRQ